MTGGSGILLGLPANFGIAPGAPAAFAGRRGPGLVLSGSCSAATLRQVAEYARAHPVLRLTAEDALAPEAAVGRALAFVEANRGAAPMVTSSDGPEAVAAAQAAHGRERLAAGYEGIMAKLTAAAVARGFVRIVAAGGETSGAVAGASARSPSRSGRRSTPASRRWRRRRAAAGAGAEIGQLRRRRLPGPGAPGAGGHGVTGEERALRDEICRLAGSMFARGLTAGSSGNLSAPAAGGRLPDDADELLPRLPRPGRGSRSSTPPGAHVAGDPPTKEVPLHMAFYGARPQAGGVVHLHSTYATALSCLADTDPDDCIPPITPYVVMRVGRVPLIPYTRPGRRRWRR